MLSVKSIIALALLLAASADAFAPLVGGRSCIRSPRRTQQKEHAADTRIIGTPLLQTTAATKLQVSTVPMPEDFKTSPLSGVKNAIQKFAHTFKNNEVAQWRAVFLTFFASLYIFQGAIDVKLAQLWPFLMTSQSVWGRVFRSDHYEWMLAVGAFTVWIHGFWLADRLVRKGDEQGRVHPWKKFRLQDRFEADKHRRMLERRASTTTDNAGMEVSVGESDASALPSVTKQSPWNKWGYLVELPVYVVPLLLWDTLAPRRHRRLAPFGAPTTMGMVGGIVGGLVLYDLMFFVGHLAMHKIPFIYRTVHTKHHTAQEVRSAEIVRLSFVEEVLEVAFSIIGLNLLGVHPLARSIYNCVITFLLTELHCGFDFPWTPQNVVPFGLMTGSRRHHYHHRFGKHYYQKFFFTVDRLFNFFQKNDGSLNGDSVQPKPYIPASWK